MRDITRIIIHCSATPPGMNIGATEIRRWHVEGNGWNDIGYHFIIRRSGRIEHGRPLSEAGAHVAGHNGNSIGICMIGGLNEQGKAAVNFTRAQWSTLNTLVQELAATYAITDVRGHRDWNIGTECPCFDVQHWWRVEND